MISIYHEGIYLWSISATPEGIPPDSDLQESNGSNLREPTEGHD